MKKFEAFIQKTCRILELALAVLVMIGIVLALLSFFKDGVIFIDCYVILICFNSIWIGFLLL